MWLASWSKGLADNSTPIIVCIALGFAAGSFRAARPVGKVNGPLGVSMQDVRQGWGAGVTIFSLLQTGLRFLLRAGLRILSGFWSSRKLSACASLWYQPVSSRCRLLLLHLSPMHVLILQLRRGRLCVYMCRRRTEMEHQGKAMNATKREG